MPEGLTLDSPCEGCGHVGDNMLCLGDNRVLCGRHASGCMVRHVQSDASRCPLVLSFLDLSVWDYGQDAYLDTFTVSELHPHFDAVHRIKFGEPASLPKTSLKADRPPPPRGGNGGGIGGGGGFTLQLEVLPAPSGATAAAAVAAKGAGGSAGGVRAAALAALQHLRVEPGRVFAPARFGQGGPSDGESWTQYRAVGGLPEATRAALLATAAADVEADRALGAVVGMCVGDAVGAPLEFIPVANGDGAAHPEAHLALSWGPFQGKEGFEYSYKGECNKFRLARGQWTDDASMGLCLADAFLFAAQGQPPGAPLRSLWPDGGTASSSSGGSSAAEAVAVAADADPAAAAAAAAKVAAAATKAALWSDTRSRFHTWWFFGYNNAFRNDQSGRGGGSVGLGGNIAKSLYSCTAGSVPAPFFERTNEDAGIGSIMRLAPVAVALHGDVCAARRAAAESSFTTHPGPLAAECCALLAHLIVRAIHAPAAPPAASPATAKAFLDACCAEYDALLEERLAAATASGPTAASAVCEVRRLLASAEPEGSPERCWNWKAPSLEIHAVLASRGQDYNGYPVLPGYFGAFCMDGLAMALWSVYHSASFDGAVERCVNLLGDADSTAAVAGQLAGAFYGLSAINPAFRRDVRKWDDDDAAVRAALLFALGE